MNDQDQDTATASRAKAGDIDVWSAVGVQQCTVSGGGSLEYFCTRLDGHAGNHVEGNGHVVLAVWSR